MLISGLLDSAKRNFATFQLEFHKFSVRYCSLLETIFPSLKTSNFFFWHLNFESGSERLSRAKKYKYSHFWSALSQMLCWEHEQEWLVSNEWVANSDFSEVFFYKNFIVFWYTSFESATGLTYIQYVPDMWGHGLHCLNENICQFNNSTFHFPDGQLMSSPISSIMFEVFTLFLDDHCSRIIS